MISSTFIYLFAYKIFIYFTFILAFNSRQDEKEREREEDSEVTLRVYVKDNRKWLRESVILPRIFIYIFHRTSRAYLPFSFVVIRRNTNNGHTVGLRDGSRCLDCTCILRYCDCHQSRELFRDIFQICPRQYVWLSRIIQRFAAYSMTTSGFCTAELETVHRWAFMNYSILMD